MAIESLGSKRPVVHPDAWVHPSATLIGDIEIGPRCSIWPGVVLRADDGPIRIGEGTNIQDNTVIHGVREGTFVGSYCMVGHLAFIEEATVEDECLIGIGSKVLNGARVRAGAVVAAGAVLVQGLEVPSGFRAQGVPARLAENAGRTRAEIRAGAERYIERARQYRTMWSPEPQPARDNRLPGAEPPGP